MEFQQNQRSELREHFRNHIYYKLCRAVHRVFLQHTPSIIMNAEVLFVDAVKTLDILLTEGDFEKERCVDLWSDTLSDYRERDGARADMATTQAEVAMLFYAVNYGLWSVNHSHYRKTLALTLHQSIHELWNCNEKENCVFVENKLQEIKTLSNDMYEWMDTYFSSTESLTDEIENIINPNKANQIAKTGLPLPNALNTQNAQKYFLEAINRGWMELENKTTEEIPNDKAVHRGQQKQYLFIDGRPTVENVQVRNEEKQRFMRYLSEHNLKGRKLTCVKTDTLNDVVICFVIKWKDKNITPKQPSGGAIFRFLTDECNLQSEVTEQSYSNEIKERLRNNNYTIETMKKVNLYFNL